MDCIRILNNETSLQRIAKRFAAFFQKPGVFEKKPYIFCLKGDLGAGKTSFVRSFLRAYTGDSNLCVPSPTFSLVQTYCHDHLWHFDCYRLKHAQEFFELGFEEALEKDLIFIEWYEVILPYLPTQNIFYITLELHHKGDALLAQDIRLFRLQTVHPNFL